MKKIFTLFLIVFPALFLTPAAAFAHTDNGVLSGPVMMRAIEDRALGEPLHEEMENLMEKMLSGEVLSDAEADQIITFMNDYPGPYGMMMNRMMGGDEGTSFSRTGGMMGMMGGAGWGNGLPFVMWFMWALAIVWLIV